MHAFNHYWIMLSVAARRPFVYLGQNQGSVVFDRQYRPISLRPLQKRASRNLVPRRPNTNTTTTLSTLNILQSNSLPDSMHTNDTRGFVWFSFFALWRSVSKTMKLFLTKHVFYCGCGVCHLCHTSRQTTLENLDGVQIRTNTTVVSLLWWLRVEINFGYWFRASSIDRLCAILIFSMRSYVNGIKK